MEAEGETHRNYMPFESLKEPALWESSLWTVPLLKTLSFFFGYLPASVLIFSWVTLGHLHFSSQQSISLKLLNSLRIICPFSFSFLRYTANTLQYNFLTPEFIEVLNGLNNFPEKTTRWHTFRFYGQEQYNFTLGDSFWGNTQISPSKFYIHISSTSDFQCYGGEIVGESDFVLLQVTYFYLPRFIQDFLSLTQE